MSRLTLLLILASVAVTSAFLYDELYRSPVLVDSENCVRLRCHWRGEAAHCGHRGAYKWNTCGLGFKATNKNDTDTEFLLRLKMMYPVNTFTIDNVKLAEGCEEEKRLCCNVERVDVYGQYELNCEAQPAFHHKKQHKFWW